MKRPNSEALEKVFHNLSESDLEKVNGFVLSLGVLSTVWDPVTRFHFQLAVAAVVEEIRELEVGARTLGAEEKGRIKELLEMKS